MDKKQPAIFACNLSKEYQIGDSIIQAINNINMEISEGEFVCIEGPSGAGKTTVLNIIGGLERPTRGDIKVFGYDLNNCSEDLLAVFRCVQVGFVFQSYNLISTLTAAENIAFAIELAGFSDERLRERPKKLLADVGLFHRANHFPSQLSGGEQQRVAFARALANDPPLLLVDEPTANLDEKTALEIVKILEKLRHRQKTVIVATHDERIIRLGDRVFHLKDGRLDK